MTDQLTGRLPPARTAVVTSRLFTAAELEAKSRKNRESWRGHESAADWTKRQKPAETPKKAARAAQARGGAVPTEHMEQVALIAWWDAYARLEGYDPRLLMAIPNAGAGASRGQAGKMKAEGVRAGAPDLFLAIPQDSGHKCCGLWIELKRANWKEPSAGVAATHWRNQCAFHQLLQNFCYRVRVCAGAESAIAAITDYLK